MSRIEEEIVMQHLHGDSAESGQRPVESRVLFRGIPGVSASMIRMFM